LWILSNRQIFAPGMAAAAPRQAFAFAACAVALLAFMTNTHANSKTMDFRQFRFN
jgi:hypothetical protein